MQDSGLRHPEMVGRTPQGVHFGLKNTPRDVEGLQNIIHQFSLFHQGGWLTCRHPLRVAVYQTMRCYDNSPLKTPFLMMQQHQEWPSDRVMGEIVSYCSTRPGADWGTRHVTGLRALYCPEITEVRPINGRVLSNHSLANLTRM
ncbi:hypothetical protein AVEN_270022-1 [Araneus ventricosus]|uniref:Uncharacterized protein n=1 Tax=Araneus ventricosus TaxID=182803 RepID=A0A4Y2H431_ARAVE|nr:hypothetical protein AVEN_270022-1 [Araneus ventricosus]